MANHLEDWEVQVQRDYDIELADADGPRTDDAPAQRRRRRGD
jgi:hypothetical protein